MKYLLIITLTLALLSCDTKQKIVVESDAVGQVTQKTEANGRADQPNQDAAGQIVQKTDANGRADQPNQDAAGQEVQKTDANGRADQPNQNAAGLADQPNDQPNLGKSSATKAPKNIILLIGDGMGLAQITAGMYSNGNKTSLERFKHIGLQKTYSADDVVTDSAASATAFACGVKTYNNAIGMDRDTMPVKSILKYAQDNMMATGLVATSTIVHATPACFFSNNMYRRNYEEIATDMVGSGVDLFIGGGKKFFDRREMDDRNLLDELIEEGYSISHFAEKDIDEIVPALDKKFGYLTADADPIPVSGGRDYLIPASDLAIDYLNNKGGENGFFVMIEGSQIDWGGHANLLEYVVTEFIEYDQVIDLALNFAEKDGNTLVIVTADHETGGMAIQPKSTMDSLQAAFTTTKHSGVMVPVFAYGPGAENFQGIYENTEIFEKMKALLASER